MSTPADLTLDRLRQDLREFARLSEARYVPAAVDPVLDALAELWTSSWIGVRTTTHPVGQREVSARLMNSSPTADPVGTLRDAGLLTFTGHPMEKLLTEIPAAVPVRWGVDLAVATGVQKIWLVFPELLTVRRMLGFSGVPAAAGTHAEHLTRYGGDIGMMAIDFVSHTMNWYSRVLTPGELTPSDIVTILRELNFAPAADEELALFARTFNAYRTFSWNSPDIQRICFPVRSDAAGFPTHLDPVLERFVTGAPYADTGPRGFVFYTAYGPTGRYYKVQADYTSALNATFPGGTRPPMQ
ncbi:aromatic prenyltransferase [Nocardia sp. GAS34]|jgi:aromatic prenyltransferase|uniref:aromatic prenyltransferase n=1 Tax=unclassified Nocardia TaxID=2637762 RepID=UPI003D1AB6ED